MANAPNKRERAVKIIEMVARGLRVEAETGEDTPEAKQLLDYAKELDGAVQLLSRAK